MSLFTETRLALWRSVDGWPALADRLRQTVRFFDPKDPNEVEHGFQRDLPGEDGPTCIHRMPCLAMSPATHVTAAHSNQTAYLPYTVRLQIWTDGWTYDESELLWNEWINAINLAKPVEPGLTYLKLLGLQRYTLEAVTWQRVFLGTGRKVPAVQLTGGVTLHLPRLMTIEN